MLCLDWYQTHVTLTALCEFIFIASSALNLTLLEKWTSSTNLQLQLPPNVSFIEDTTYEEFQKS